MRIRNVVLVAFILLTLIISSCGKQAINPGPEGGAGEDQTGAVDRDDGENVLKEYTPKFLEVPSLKEVYGDYFKIGAAIDYNNIEKYRDILLKHFNSITPGNSMKPESTQPVEGKFLFDHADEVINFAIENGMDIRGHTLVWHSQTPAWFFKDENGDRVSREVALERMREHIFAVMGHYKGKVKEWDVVNEPISDDDSSILRTDSPWYQAIGEDYVKMAFIYAHEADPEAKLFINDYNIVAPGKRERFYNFVKGLLEEGVPIHGIGIQGHWQLDWPSYEDIRYALELFSGLGLEIQITEMDISIYSWNDSAVYSHPPAELMEKQAERYRKLFDLFKEYSDVITKVTIWGVADDDTWLDNFPVPNRKNWPLLFDVNHQPKESFWRIVGQPVLSNIKADTGNFLKPFNSGILSYVLGVPDGVDSVGIKPIANDRSVTVNVEGAEKSGDYYVIPVDGQAPQVKITVSGYGRTNTYELYIHRQKSGMIAGWEFDEGQGSFTSDTTNYAGQTDINSLSWVDGVKGKALRFGGEEGHYIDLGLGDMDLFGSSNFSVSVWVRPEQVGRTGVVLWYGQPSGIDSLLWRISIVPGGAVYFHVQSKIDVELARGSQFVTTDSGIIKPDEWAHVVCVRRGDVLRIYVNGNLEKEQAFGYTVDLGGVNSPLLAGKDKDGRGDDFKGVIDSIRIFNYALSDEEILELYREYNPVN